MYVCICAAVTEKQVLQTLACGACSVKALQQKLGVASRCAKCARCAHELVQQHRQKQQRLTPPAANDDVIAVEQSLALTPAEGFAVS